MKLSEAEKIAVIIQGVEDQHGSARASIKIRAILCDEMSEAFPDYRFSVDMVTGEVGARKKRMSTDSMGKSLPNN